MKITNLINTILWTAFLALLVLGYANFTDRYFDLKFAQLKQQSVTDCLTASGTYERLNSQTGEKTVYPQKEVYRACLTDKGYETSWK